MVSRLIKLKKETFIHNGVGRIRRILIFPFRLYDVSLIQEITAKLFILRSKLVKCEN